MRLWATYTNQILGVSFEYPPNIKTNSGEWSTGSCDAGHAFHATIGLPSGAVSYVYALTKNYSAPKDGPGVGTEGYVISDRNVHCSATYEGHQENINTYLR